jgi:ribosomal protein L40E
MPENSGSTVSQELVCFRCGATLRSLPLPLSRQDQCPFCSVYLHVCMMCESFDPNVSNQCREDDAEPVHEKERANFCEWFRPGTDVFDAHRAAQEDRSKEALSALFTDRQAEPQDPSEDDITRSAAEDLFK